MRGKRRDSEKCPAQARRWLQQLPTWGPYDIPETPRVYQPENCARSKSVSWLMRLDRTLLASLISVYDTCSAPYHLIFCTGWYHFSKLWAIQVVERQPARRINLMKLGLLRSRCNLCKARSHQNERSRARCCRALSFLITSSEIGHTCNLGLGNILFFTLCHDY